MKCAYCFPRVVRSLGERPGFSYHGLLKNIVKASKMSFFNLMRTAKFKLSAFKREIPPINIPALIRTLEETNKIFHISFGGSEPFLVPNIIDACIEITRRHFISVITNLTLGNIKEFAEKIDPKRVMCISASVHFKELERLNLLENFIDNFITCQKNGFNITACEVAYPPFSNEVGVYKKNFGRKGITVRFDPFIGVYDGRYYPQAYTEEELRRFGLNSLCYDIFNQKGQLCNAGYNAAIVTPAGVIKTCYQIGEDLGNIYRKITFKNRLVTCPFNFCSCPLNRWDPYLLKKALCNFS